MTIRNLIIRLPGKTGPGSRWKIREAVSIEAACNAIVAARMTGSVGHRDLSATFPPNSISWVDRIESVLADVVQVNSDNSERKPYSEWF